MGESLVMGGVGVVLVVATGVVGAWVSTSVAVGVGVGLGIDVPSLVPVVTGVIVGPCGVAGVVSSVG